MVEVYGLQRIWLNCACDWGRSDPLAVPKTALEMKRRGHSEAAIDRLIYGNPLQFLSQNPRFRLDEVDGKDRRNATQK
jgi:predicted metal-dependent TIM-barrel fold hydrolase